MPRFCCKIAVVVDENWMMRRRSQSVKVPIGRTVGLALSSAVIMSGISEIKVARSQPMPSLQLNIATSIAHPPLADGIYLYGDVPQANQLGQGYVVFKKNGSTVTGAFFYPQSEFNCFTGHINQERLDVLSLGSPHEEAIAVEASLSQMHPIQTLGNAEKDSLSLCQQEVAAYQKQQSIAAPINP